MCDVAIARGMCSKDGICNDDSLFPLFGCHCEELFKKCLSVSHQKDKTSNEPISQPLISQAVMTKEEVTDKKERFKAFLMGSLYFTVSPMLLERQCLRPGPAFSAPAEWWPFDTDGYWNGWAKTNLSDIDREIFF